MFTDGPVTPIRLEVLLDVLKKYPDGMTSEEIYNLLQPLKLCPPSEGTTRPKQTTARNTLSAARELELVEGTQSAKLSKNYNKSNTSKENLLRVMDQKVLSDCNYKVEFYLALYYAYFLGLSKKVYEMQMNYTNETWAAKFNAGVFGNKRKSNPFNPEKFSGLHRWLNYLGLGWNDPSGKFQANPYERLKRALPSIFEGESELSGDDFMKRLAKFCPELDGGKIFLEANEYQKYKSDDKQCSLGLSHALVDLYEDKIIDLDCPTDSDGWDFRLADPPPSEKLVGTRIARVIYVGGK